MSATASTVIWAFPRPTGRKTSAAWLRSRNWPSTTAPSSSARSSPPSTAIAHFARSLLPEGRFVEIYTKCDIELCKRRDPKGLYAKALRGEIAEFTGITSPYEAPAAAELVIETDLVSAEDAVEQILAELMRRGIIERR